MFKNCYYQHHHQEPVLSNLQLGTGVPSKREVTTCKFIFTYVIIIISLVRRPLVDINLPYRVPVASYGSSLHPSQYPILTRLFVYFVGGRRCACRSTNFIRDLFGHLFYMLYLRSVLKLCKLADNVLYNKKEID